MTKDGLDHGKLCGVVPPELLAMLRAVAELPDDQINTVDLPEVTDWSGAVRSRFYSSAERQVAMMLKADASISNRF